LERGPIGPLGWPEASIQIYRSTLRNMPEKRRRHLHRGRDAREDISEDPRRSFDEP